MVILSISWMGEADAVTTRYVASGFGDRLGLPESDGGLAVNRCQAKTGYRMNKNLLLHRYMSHQATCFGDGFEDDMEKKEMDGVEKRE